MGSYLLLNIIPYLVLHYGNIDNGLAIGRIANAGKSIEWPRYDVLIRDLIRFLKRVKEI